MLPFQSSFDDSLSSDRKDLRLGYGSIYPTTSSEEAQVSDDDDPMLESLRQGRSLKFDDVYDLNDTMDETDNAHDYSAKQSENKSGSASFADAMADPSQIGKASIHSEVMSIAKNLLGAGVLSLSRGIAAYSNDPYAMLSATIQIVLLGAMFGYFCLLLAKICHKTRSTTYRECWESTMGDRGGVAVSIVTALLPAQGNLSATTVLSQTMQSLLQTCGVYWSRLTCLLLLTILVLLPICLMKDLDSISPFSTLGVVSMGVATIAMVIRYLDGSYQEGGVYFDGIPSNFQPSFGHETFYSLQMLPFVCMVFNSYIMHYNVPRFYMELKDRSIPRFRLAVGWSFGLCSVFLILIAGAGYLTFGAHSAPYILNNYSPNDPLATASRIGVFLSTLLMYPIAFFGVRDGLLDVFGVPHYLQTTKFLDGVSVLVLSLLTVCAVFFDDLGTINAVGGGALATFLCFVFPAMMYRNLIVNSLDRSKGELLESWVALFLMVIGVLLGSVGLYQSFI